MSSSAVHWSRLSSDAGRRTDTNERRISILLVDDDPAIHRFVAAALGEKKFRLVSTVDVAAALLSIQTEPPDLVMLDLELGGVPGWKLLEVLRSDPAYRRVPVVILSASAETADRQRSLKMGADRYLTKPVSPEQIKKTIRELMSTRDDLWFAMSLGSGESVRLRELLYDPTARVQTLASAIQSLRPQVEEGRTIWAWWIAFHPLFEVEGALWEMLDEFRRKMVRGIEILISPILGGNVTVSVTHPGANEFQCFAQYETSPTWTAAQQIAIEKVVRNLAADTRKEIGLDEQIAVFVSYATTSGQALYAPRLLYEAVRAGREGAEQKRNVYFRKMTQMLRLAIAQGAITTGFQPVVEIGSGHCFGFEALSRGPAGAEFERSALLFELARQADLMWELETLCIGDVVPHLVEICSQGKLFFRLEGTFIRQLHSRGAAALEPLLECRESIIMVVAESSVAGFAVMRDALRDLKRMGFAIALEGSGSASLEMLAELSPDYLKMGHALLQQIDNAGVRYRLLQSLARMATDVGAKMIAGTIENEKQRQVCMELDIPLGQGPLFGRSLPWPGSGPIGASGKLAHAAPAARHTGGM